MANILVCEDEAAIREFIVLNLEKKGYGVIAVGSGEEAINEFKKHQQQLKVVLLDIMMNGINGREVCKYIRRRDENIGIIMISALGQEINKVGSLMEGADDYITKPFSISELMARVDAVYRRSSVDFKSYYNDDTSKIISGDFELDTKSHIFRKNGEIIDLIQTEYKIILCFLKNPHIAIDRETMLEYCRGSLYSGDPKIIDVNVRRLRLKIENTPSSPQHIQTIWGYGYRWEE